MSNTRRSAVGHVQRGLVLLVAVVVGLMHNTHAAKIFTVEKAADNPAELPASAWKLTLQRTMKALKDKKLALTASSLAYHATLTFFPAALGAATIYANFAGTDALRQAIDSTKVLLPRAMYELIHAQLLPLTQASHKSLAVASILSIAALIWTTSGGLQNLIEATNIAYSVDESRNVIKLRLLAVLMSIALLAFGAVVLPLLLLQGTALTSLHAPHIVAVIFPILRWPLLIGLISIALSFIYRYAPNRQEPRWQWVSWGAAAATIIWLAGSAVFFIYAQNFANFNKTYGIFAGIIVLMSWFNLSSLIIILGAQVNHELEKVTRKSNQHANF
jgi:membrane protein